MSTRDQAVIDWLLEEDEPSVRYKTLADLLDRSGNDEEVRAARSELAKRGWGAEILGAQNPAGYWESRESLYQPKFLATNWRAIVLADLGLTIEEPRIEATAAVFFKDWMPDGHFDEEEHCIVGNLARTLASFGYAGDPRVRELYDKILDSQKEDGGWHCFPSKKGTLDCWEGLAAFAVLPRSSWSRRVKSSVERGAEFYLERRLYRQGHRYDPWFRFHYPVHYYYDLLLGLDLITGLGYAGDARLKPALKLLESKRRPDGTWKLDAVHPDEGGAAGRRMRKIATPFSLEKRGVRSKWITLTCLRVLRRVEGAS